MSRIDATQAFLRLKGCLGLSPNMFEVSGEVLGCRESIGGWFVDENNGLHSCFHY